MPVLEVMVGGQIPIDIHPISKIKLLQLLGSGGFASAWKVVDPTTGKNYLLKIIQGIVPGSVVAERVRMEAQVSIPSSHIVAPIGLREWDPSTYLILFEFFEGTPLDQLIEQNMLSRTLKESIFRQVLQAVSDAHTHNIIHRDLKPANILVGKDGQIKLIDFGISKFKGERGVTQTGEMIGTLSYMAPELIIRGIKIADARTDIYSLGQILYELAMGKHFWMRKGWSELSDLIGFLTQTPEPTEVIELDDFNCDFYTNAGQVIRRMVKIDPDERFQSVDEIITQLGYRSKVEIITSTIKLRYPLLIVESGSNKGAQLLINIDEGTELIIGRVHIAGQNASISRQHIKFTRQGDCFFVQDLESKNGTLVRGIAVKSDGSPMAVKHLDRIRVGDVFLRFVSSEN